MALSFRAVDYILNNRNVSAKLFQSLLPYHTIVEAFFPVLQFNPVSLTGFPGGMVAPLNSKLYSPEPLTRTKIGQEIVGVGSCFCILGFYDLLALTKKFYGSLLVANKFYWDFEPLAWDCMQNWHNQKMEKEKRNWIWCFQVYGSTLLPLYSESYRSLRIT